MKSAAKYPSTYRLSKIIESSGFLKPLMKVRTEVISWECVDTVRINRSRISTMRRIHKKIWGSGTYSSGTTITNNNKKKKKKKKGRYNENSAVSQRFQRVKKDVTQTIEKETYYCRSRCLGMSLGILSASLLDKIFAGNAVIKF